MDVTTGNYGTGWNFDDFSLPVPVQVRRAPSLEYDGEQFLSDADLYLQRIDVPNMHPEVQEALREAVRCFRSELYTAAVAMLGKASEGSWLLIGAALLRAAGPTHTATFERQRRVLDDSTVLCNYSHRVKFSRYSHHRLADARRRRIFMMRSTQYRLREHSDTLPQSMARFHLLNHSQYVRRIRDSRTQAAVRSTTIGMFYPTCQD